MAGKIVGKLQIKGGMFNRTRTLYEERCSRCGQLFESIFPQMAGRPIYCAKCVNQTGTLNVRLAQLDREKRKNAGNPAKLAKIEHEIEKLNRLLKHK